MKGWVYDLIARFGERKGFAELRAGLVGGLEGDVLDLGAGTGLNLPHYRSAGRVVALEPDESMAARLRRRVASAPVPVEVVSGRGESLPFPDASFDHVVSSLVLCSVDDLEGTLAEIHRVLKPGGSLAVIEHVRGRGRVASWQDRLTPVQERVADGCHLNRETGRAFDEAGFDDSGIVRFALPGAHALLRPGIYGRATRISS